MNRRRAFITLLGGAAVWPLAARAQQGGRMRRIGYLVSRDENDPLIKSFVSVFTQALAGLGWTDGRNVRIDLRGGRWDRRVNSRHNCKTKHEIRTSRIFPALKLASRVMVGVTEPEMPIASRGPQRDALGVSPLARRARAGAGSGSWDHTIRPCYVVWIAPPWATGGADDLLPSAA